MRKPSASRHDTSENSCSDAFARSHLGNRLPHLSKADIWDVLPSLDGPSVLDVLASMDDPDCEECISSERQAASKIAQTAQTVLAESESFNHLRIATRPRLNCSGLDRMGTRLLKCNAWRGGFALGNPYVRFIDLNAAFAQRPTYIV